MAKRVRKLIVPYPITYNKRGRAPYKIAINTIANEIRKQVPNNQQPLKKPLKVQLVLHPGVPRYDNDNPVKPIFDALIKANVIKDDAQIIEHNVRRHKRLPPYGLVVIKIQSIQDVSPYEEVAARATRGMQKIQAGWVVDDREGILPKEHISRRMVKIGADDGT